MKVYIITKEPFPNGMAATNRVKCYARAIHDGGIECEVLICSGTEIERSIIRNTNASGMYEGIPFKYIGGSPIVSSNMAVRLLSQVNRQWKTECYLRRSIKKGDVILLFMGGKVRRMLRFMEVAHSRGAFCVRDLCELPYGTGTETRRTIRLRKVTFEKQFPKLDGIISISDALLNLSKEYTLSSCKHIKVPIMVEFDHYCLTDRSSEVGIPYIFHSGTLYQQKDGILDAIEAFGIALQRLSKPIKYILTGSLSTSPHAKEIQQLIDKYHLEGAIEFVGYLVRDQVKAYLSRASLVISNRPKSKQDFYGFSTKVGEYLASGTPLITTRWGEVANWLKNEETAYVIEPENTDALAAAIVRVFNNLDEAKHIGIMGRALCEKCFNYRSWSEPLVSFMNHLGER